MWTEGEYLCEVHLYQLSCYKPITICTLQCWKWKHENNSCNDNLMNINFFYSQRGIYYFMTNSKSPYAQGRDTYEKKKTTITPSTTNSSQIDQNGIALTDP